jgi:orotidine-5'-phosphate decarboxylase
LLCIGLDPDKAKLPVGHDQFTFNKAIIDATANLVCAFKPNPAFYEAHGSEGVIHLEKTCQYLKEMYPEIPLILDFKRGDIGNTNQAYASAAFDQLYADAVTLHTYLGQEAIQTFLDYKDKGIFLMVRTSNPGAGEFQDLEIMGKPLYQHIAQAIVDKWNTNKNCMFITGATYPDELRHLRKIAGPDMPFLSPGIGPQGAITDDAARAGLNAHGTGLILNSSRQVIFASSGSDFAEAARAEATKLRDSINSLRS